MFSFFALVPTFISAWLTCVTFGWNVGNCPWFCFFLIIVSRALIRTTLNSEFIFLLIDTTIQGIKMFTTFFPHSMRKILNLNFRIVHRFKYLFESTVCSPAQCTMFSTIQYNTIQSDINKRKHTLTQRYSCVHAYMVPNTTIVQCCSEHSQAPHATSFSYGS